MPDSVPDGYKKLAEMCWDADPDKRPDAYKLYSFIIDMLNDRSEIWETIYHNNVRPLSHLEKESKYSSKLLPTGDLSRK